MATRSILFILLLVTLTFSSAFAQLNLTAVDSKTRILTSGAVTGSTKAAITGIPNSTVSFQMAFTTTSGSYPIATAYTTSFYNSAGKSISNQTAVKYFRVQCDAAGTPTGSYTTANYSKPLIQLVNPGDPTNPNLPIPVTTTANGAMWMDITIPSGTAPGVYEGYFLAYPTGLGEKSMLISLTVASSSPTETVSAPTAITGAAATTAGKSESFTASGAASSLGHTAAYRYDWGDGIISAWGNAAQSHSWSAAGSFSIKSQARCAADTANISAWSGSLKSETVSYLALNVTVNPGSSGTVTKNPNKTGYSYNDSVQLSVSPAAGYSFSGWSGDATGSTSPLTVSMSSSKNITATFSAVAGETISSPTAVTGASATTAGKSESFTASGATSSLGHTVAYRFDWGDGNISSWGNAAQSHLWTAAGTFSIKSQARCAADTAKISVWTGSLKSVTVSFLTMTVTANPSGSGSISKSPDKSGYSYNESVQLTASPAAGYSFSNWSGDATGATNPLTVAMATSKNITAIFSIISGPVETVSAPTAVTGAAATTVGKNESFTASGAVSSLGHTAAYRFDWGDGNISAWGNAAQNHIWTAAGTFSIKSQARCAADTVKISAWTGSLKSVTVSYLTLSVTVAPGSTGTVTKNPDKSGYSYNESVQLTGSPAAGYSFSSWSGDVSGTTNPLTVAMTSGKSITANFQGQGLSTTVQLTAFNSMVRIPRSGSLSGGNTTAGIKAAKNEVESFQVAITAKSGTPQVTAAVLSDLTTSSGAKIANTAATFYRVDYVNISSLSPSPDAGYTTGYYADPLIPFINPVTGQPINKSGGTARYALPIDVSSTLNGAIWVDVKVPSTAASGVYNGSLTVTCSDLSKVSIPVTLTVWNFVLPDGPTAGSNFGYFNNITTFYGPAAGTTAYNAIESRYAEETARNRINPPVPVRFLPEGDSNGNLIMSAARQDSLDKFVARNHVTGIQIAFESVTTPTLLANFFGNYTNYMAAHGWLDGAYYWPIDEPNTSADYAYIVKHNTHYYTGRPVVRTLTTEQTWPQDPTWPDISSYVDNWCPVFEFIDETSINQKIAKGNKVWAYTALANTTPTSHPQYATLKGKHSAWWQIDRPLTNYRVPMWFNYRYHITGLLYYNMMTSGIPDPWSNPKNTLYGGYNGDGMLYYPGTPCGYQGPVPTMRLKNLRDGMEDYEYMILLQKNLGYAGVMNYVKAVSSEWWIFSTNPSDFAAARENMANMIAGGAPAPKIVAAQTAQPGEFKVGKPFPNPFNPSTVIKFQVPKDCAVKLFIYDALGRKVAELQNGMIHAGEHEAVWNGHDMNGNSVASGIYIYSFSAENYRMTGKVTFMK